MLGLPDLASIVIGVLRHPSMIHEHIEMFNFYYATSYNPGVHALDYGNNDTQLHLRVSS